MDTSDAGLAWDVVQRYDDPATPEFDAVLAAADLPPDVARALRFWQRESVASVKQYAAQAIPAVLVALAEAQADADAATRRSAAAWDESGPAVRRAPELVIVLPEPGPADGPPERTALLLEQRRRTVAARLAQQG